VAPRALHSFPARRSSDLRSNDLDIGQAIAAGRVWAGWVTLSPDHIYSKIQRKADAYADLAARSHTPYTVCLFGEFTACVDPVQRSEEHTSELQSRENLVC